MNKTEIQIGTIAQINATDYTAKVKIGENLTAFLPIATTRSGISFFYAMPKIGEQVIVLTPFGRLEQGLIVGTIFKAGEVSENSDNKISLKTQDGASFVYTTNGTWQVNIPSKIEITAPTTTLNSETTINGNTKINGSLNVSISTTTPQLNATSMEGGSLNAKNITGANITSGAISLQNHKHPTVGKAIP